MKTMKKLLGLVLTLVMALSLVPAAGAASMEPVESIAVSQLVKPWVGDTPSTDITISDGVTVQDCYWWWDSDGNGAADEDHCTEFKEGGKYYCRIILAPEGGYTFPSTQVLGRRGTFLNKYTGTITVNGTAVTDAVYVADAGTMSFDWWKDAAISGYYMDNSNTTVVVQMPIITQQPQDAEIAKGGIATFTVAAQHTAELHYQWYGLINTNGVVARLPKKVDNDAPRCSLPTPSAIMTRPCSTAWCPTTPARSGRTLLSWC